MNKLRILAGFILLGVSGLSAPALAATFTVNSTGDTNVCNVSTCTLRGAITAANAAAGADSITFSIGTGQAAIALGSSLPPITEQLTIDGTFQPGYTGVPLIILDGQNIVTNGLIVNAPNTTIIALVICRFTNDGVQITGSGSHIQSSYVGTDPAGATAKPNGRYGVFVNGASNVSVGGEGVALGNLISGNTSDGVHVTGGTGNLVQGNRIGLNAAGNAAIGNGGNGVVIEGSANGMVGCTVLPARNWIAGNTLNGVLLTGAGTSSFIVGANLIGTNQPGTDPVANGGAGVMVTAGASNNAIGGTSSPASPNLIAFNGGAGISLTSTAGTGNAIRHNSIDLNGGLGIDLDADGVTPNDPGDTDSGPNALMNYPVLTSVTLSGGSAAVAGTLNSLPGANFNIDYFASKNPDASGFGEAGRFLATAGASTDGSGNATLSPSLIARLMPGEWLTATATDSSDNTSELSRALFVQTLFADVHSAAGTASNTNRVFEPGETVLVEPAWQNVGAVPLTLTGAASSFIGPSGPGVTYTLVDPIATYGLIAPNAKNDCFTAGHCYQFMVSNPATRPALHWDSTFLETMSDGRTKTWTLHIGSSFTDVPTSAGYYRFVEALLHSGITAGCGGTGYCPGSPVTRAQMAVFLLLAEHGSAYIPPPATGTVFADVPASNGFAKWIEQLAAEGITGGCGGGNYCPNSSITRQQMAVFLLVAEHGTGFNPPPATGMFADVPPSSGFAKWVERLAVEGVTSGCGSGNFCPNDPVSRGQMAVFLSVAFGISLYGT